MAGIQSIREEYLRKGKNISEIAREHGMDRKTDRKFIEQEDWNRNTKQSSLHASILDPLKPVIDGWLEEDRRKRRK